MAHKISKNNNVDNTYRLIEQNGAHAHGRTWTIGKKIDEVFDAIIQALKDLFGISEQAQKPQKDWTGASVSQIFDRGPGPVPAPKNTETHALPKVDSDEKAPAQRKSSRVTNIPASEDFWGIGALRAALKSNDHATGALNKMGNKVIH